MSSVHSLREDETEGKGENGRENKQERKKERATIAREYEREFRHMVTVSSYHAKGDLSKDYEERDGLCECEEEEQ